MHSLLAEPLCRLPHHLHRAALQHQTGRHAPAQEGLRARSSGLIARGANPEHFDRSSWKTETKLLGEQLRSTVAEEQPARPWSFLVPSLEDMRRRDWPDLVKDWPIFWVRTDSKLGCALCVPCCPAATIQVVLSALHDTEHEMCS